MIADPQSPVCRKPAGGVAAVELSSAANIREAAFDGGGSLQRCTQLDFADDEAVMRCRLLEDRSSLVERLSVEGGAAIVTHTLRLVADRNTARAWLEPRFAEELMCCGCVAAVTLADGRRVVAGVSRKFGTGQPLKLRSLTVDSGCRATDQPAVELVLESQDTAFAAALNE